MNRFAMRIQSIKLPAMPANILWVLLLSFVSSVAAQTERPEVLRAEIERISKSVSGTVGVAAVHIESGQSIYVRGDERFPMANTYKVPIAVELLARRE